MTTKEQVLVTTPSFATVSNVHVGERGQWATSPDIPMFRQNTAAFIHELPAGGLSNVEGESGYVRVQVLTNAGGLDRDKQLAVVRRFTDLAASAVEDPSLSERTWDLLTEAIEGGWGLWGHAHTNEEVVATAWSEIGMMTPEATQIGE